MNPQLIEEAIREFFRIPQMLTSPASVQFIVDYLDSVQTSEDWFVLTDQAKKNLVEEVLEKLVSVGFLLSSKIRTKTHQVADDIRSPHLLVKTRVYRRNR